ncbi:MAG: hypothetical protein C5B50_07020 [Verrucomicrobia bacterium]|nr:MAG: hypothetical protein C5B50_07020 [Verrucomicrobiota bacterium]
MRDLVRNVVNLDALGGVVNEEQATAWKQRLHLLIEQGPGAVSAIREFLSGNSDIDFGSAGKQLLGYPTARAAMIDALGQIGGQSSVDTMTELLGSTADPREIALLAQNLDKLQPGIYQAAALDAARQTLAMAAQGNLPSRDVAPLFELIQRYGGASAVSDLLQNAGQWNYYAMMTLGQLPDGAGISALTQVASGQAGAGSGAKIAALQMVAQAASQSDEARTFLVEQARQGAFSAYLWAALMPILAGDQMTFQNSAFEDPLAKVPSNELRMAHLSIGNQNYLTAPLGVMTADQAQRQMALIQALSDVTSDPEGRSALQQAKNLLQQRSAQFAAVPAPGTGP